MTPKTTSLPDSQKATNFWEKTKQNNKKKETLQSNKVLTARNEIKPRCDASSLLRVVKQKTKSLSG